MAVKNGLAVAPREEWDYLLWAKFNGDIFEINDTIAYYDEDDDELVINDSHPAWTDMREYVLHDERRAAISRPGLRITSSATKSAMHYTTAV